MKRKAIFLVLLIIILSALFIPIKRQESITIKASFLSVYSTLVKPQKWEKWRPDIRKLVNGDSSKLTTKADTDSFNIQYGEKKLDVTFSGYSFNIKDNFGGKNVNYSYTVTPGTKGNTVVLTDRRTNVIGYAINQLKHTNNTNTHIADLKNFFETDSLRYGFHIVKIPVPEGNLIEIKKTVPSNQKFNEAAKMFTTLQNFVRKHHVKQMQPVIAQFLLRSKDSTDLNVGFFIDKEVKPEGSVIYTRMPKGGPLYIANFKGRFDQKQKAYDALHQYFNDHFYQSAILPFETYLDNKLPKSDTDRVNIQVNFTTFF